MRSANARAAREIALKRLAERVLEAPDLPSLTRILTRELPSCLGTVSASLLIWDRRLESFEGAVEDPRARYMLSEEGELLETSHASGAGVLVPLLARNGLSGMLVLGSSESGRRLPLSRREGRLVSTIAGRAALAIENHAYQKELIASERLAALGTMAGMLAHDFRGPMTVIRGYAETLAHAPLPQEEVLARAAMIIENVDRLERMTTETLDFARGGERLALRTVPLAVFLLELASGIQEELPGLEVMRDFDLPAAARTALDVDKLRRAASNIAANAREAMRGRGRLHVRARVEAGEGPEQLILELEDEGPGVAPAVRERLFEPFVTFGKKRGTGLGLAVARRFVEDHGGTLELLSPGEAKARGAAFRITLPLNLQGSGGGSR
jgi:signal transduction histidine kinase